MKFSIRFADQVVGVLVILGLAMLVFVVFMLGTTQRWFANDSRYVTFFPSAAGLSINMDIQHRGFTIGNVNRISLLDDDRVEVVFTIFEEYTQRVRTGSLVEVQTSPIGLGSTFIFHPGLGEEILPEGSEIPEINSVEAREIIARGLAGRPYLGGADNINAILTGVRTLIETINISVSGEPEAKELPIGQILANIGGIVEDVQGVTARLSDPDGTVMTILDSESEFYSALEDSLVSLAGVIESLNRTAEFLPAQLPQIGILIGRLNVTISSVQDVLTALANNPLLRGGIPERVETGPGGTGPRTLEF